MNSDKLYIVIPAYNEEENIRDVINQWYPLIEKYNGNNKSRLIVINDGSKDKTFEIMKELSETRPLFLPITKVNSGHGATVLFGYNYALKNGADYIFQTDSDGQTIPSEFEEFWKQKDCFDMVIGHRKNREDGLSRIFVTNILKLVIKIFFQVSVMDANTPFRLIKANTLKKYISKIPQDFNLSNVVLSVLFAKNNCNVKYLPITFRARQGGINSINIRKIFMIGIRACKDFYFINKSFNKY